MVAARQRHTVCVCQLLAAGGDIFQVDRVSHNMYLSSYMVIMICHYRFLVGQFISHVCRSRRLFGLFAAVSR